MMKTNGATVEIKMRRCKAKQRKCKMPDKLTVKKTYFNFNINNYKCKFIAIFSEENFESDFAERVFLQDLTSLRRTSREVNFHS